MRMLGVHVGVSKYPSKHAINSNCVYLCLSSPQALSNNDPATTPALQQTTVSFSSAQGRLRAKNTRIHSVED